MADRVGSAERAAHQGRVSRRTRQGDAVRNVVLGSDNFRSAQDIHAELRAAGNTVGLATVYRHLAVLTEEGQLDALQTADGEVVYRRCHSESHHHHVVCRICGRGTEVELPDLERWAESTASDLGYTEVSHTVEIFGVCSDCRNGSRELPRTDRSAKPL